MLHNEAHLHSAAATVQAIRQLNIDPPSHTHTPQLIKLILPALDYHMFRLLKKLCVDKFASDFEVKEQCIHGFDHNHSLSLHVGSEGLRTAMQYVLKQGMIMLRNDTPFAFLTDYSMRSNLLQGC